MSDSGRICIIGGPRTGKTTAAARYGGDGAMALISADDHIGMEWSAASRHIADLMRDTPGPWIAEGTAVVRALRKLLDDNANVRPCELIILYRVPWVPLSKGQATMGKGHETVWGGIVYDLEKRLGIRVLRDPKPEAVLDAIEALAVDDDAPVDAIASA